MRVRAGGGRGREADLTWVGEVTAGEPGVELRAGGRPVELRGFEHRLT